jgi:hypothetical protein
MVDYTMARIDGGKGRIGGTRRGEPTNLPGGTVVDAGVAVGDDRCGDERVALHASLDRALDDSEAGRMMDAWTFLEAHRARLRQTAR